MTRFDVSTCAHCGEPILRPASSRPAVDRRLRWLHTDERSGCINQLTREPSGRRAEPAS